MSLQLSSINLVLIPSEEQHEQNGILPFQPGLVGGHCIGVDPYYLTYKAESIGYYPQLILAGRRINEGMSKFVVSEIIKAMSKSKISRTVLKLLFWV